MFNPFVLNVITTKAGQMSAILILYLCVIFAPLP
jgi:hypothetical protein